ncbi:MAG: DoxX family protein [Flavobacteriales bacterium]|nr:DoxX family protein [Flavobacteriales bacterium]
MRLFVQICRILVGSLFIVSGLIKANDPLGFSYKLEEYFAESALNWPAFAPYALAIAVLVCVGEVVLGFAMLFGGRMKLASIAILVLTLFFGWLTLYTATCDPHGTYTVVVNGATEERSVTCVTDCGCFGDAMKGSIGRSLTPWESFIKDAILFVFLFPVLFGVFVWKNAGWNTDKDDMVMLPGGLLLVAAWCWLFTWWGPLWFTLAVYAGYLSFKRVLSGAKGEWATASYTVVVTLFFTHWCYAHLPVRDYRPYAVGKSISAQLAEGKPPVNKTFVSYKNKLTGEVKEYDSASKYPWDDPNYENVPNSTRIVEIEPGVQSQVQDFRLTDRDGYELTRDILTADQPVLLVLCYNVTKSDASNMPAIAKLAADAEAKGWYVYGMTANGWDEIESFRHEHQLAFTFAQGDEKVIKTMVRANPGILLLNGGTVKGIWPGKDAPSFEEAAGSLK